MKWLTYGLTVSKDSFIDKAGFIQLRENSAQKTETRWEAAELDVIKVMFSAPFSPTIFFNSLNVNVYII